MRLLFVHQNCPGQFKHLAPHLAADPGSQVVFLTKPGKPDLPGVRKVEYELARQPLRNQHRYLRTFEDGVLHGQAVVRAALELKREGFIPDAIVAHVGWGEALYLKDLWPSAPLLGYFEWYYHARGTDADFARESPLTLDDLARIRTRNALHLLNLETADWGITPTRWQWRQLPPEYRHKITVLHDGIDTARVTPDPAATARLGPDLAWKAGDEVVTYVARNLEPYRGFPAFVRAAERLLKRRPRCHILVVGADGVSYGNPTKDGRPWREHLLEQVDVDRERIHFLGRLPYDQYLRVLRVSAAHVYLTVPFVLSWSLLEAMAAGCLVIGSKTPPVEEVIADGRNGLLVDFFSPEAIADRVAEALDHPDRMRPLREQARRTVLERYALEHCLPQQRSLIEALVARRRPTAPLPLDPGAPFAPGERAPASAVGARPSKVPHLASRRRR